MDGRWFSHYVGVIAPVVALMLFPLAVVAQVNLLSMRAGSADPSAGGVGSDAGPQGALSAGPVKPGGYPPGAAGPAAPGATGPVATAPGTEGFDPQAAGIPPQDPQGGGYPPGPEGPASPYPPEGPEGYQPPAPIAGYPQSSMQLALNFNFGRSPRRRPYVLAYPVMYPVAYPYIYHPHRRYVSPFYTYYAGLYYGHYRAYRGHHFHRRPKFSARIVFKSRRR
jgi:hypothetical protein